MADSKGVKRLRIPNELITNKEISHHAFALYVELQRRVYNNLVRVYPYELKDKLGWTDNRTLKKHLNALCEFGAINENVDRIVNHKKIEITIVPFDKNFTQVDVNTIERIKEYTQAVRVKGENNSINLWEVALRLFYYYEKNYNVLMGYSFPPYENIQKDLGMRPSYIKTINTVFQQWGLVDVEVGKYYTVELEGSFMIRRGNNRYVPNCDRVAVGG